MNEAYVPGPGSQHILKLLEWSQGQGSLAFAVFVGGPKNGFPALLGVSVRSRQAGIVDLEPRAVDGMAVVVCLVEHPEELGDAAFDGSPRRRGEITFALWEDNTYQIELARVPWLEWDYAASGSLNPPCRISPCALAYIEHAFRDMQKRYISRPSWIARKV